MKQFLYFSAICFLSGAILFFHSRSHACDLSELTKTNIEALARAASVEVEHDVLINGEGCIVTNMRYVPIRNICKEKYGSFCEAVCP